jgi:hypothetical protein
MGGSKEMEKQPRFVAIRISRNQYEVWRRLPYGKSEWIKEFSKQLSKEELDKYAKIQEFINEWPPSVIEKKQVVIERKKITHKEAFAFFGYILLLLKEYKGDVEAVTNYLIRRFEGGG